MGPITKGTKVIIRSNRPDIAAGDDSPYIQLQFAGGSGNESSYPFGAALWSDQGSGAAYNVSIYRAQSLPDNYYIIGDYAQNDYNSPTGFVPIVTAVNDDPNDPILMPPTGYTVMWDTNGTDSDSGGTIFMPVAPVGYVAMGWIGQLGVFVTPDVSGYMCVRADFVEILTQAPTFIWDDRTSGADRDVALYSPNNLPQDQMGIFVGQNNYDSFDGTVYVFNSRVQ